jgi:formate dehydrogenase major subunit
MVEHMGSGVETGNNKYLAELAPDMYPEINPRLADSLGIRTGEMMFVESPEGGRIKVKAKVTERVDEKTIFLPYHFAGMFLGKSRADRFPPGHEPFLIGESANCVTNYGYDIITQMQSTKDGLCTVRRA